VARELLVGHDQSLLDGLRGHRDRRALRLRLLLAPAGMPPPGLENNPVAPLLTHELELR
jgi:hypothetical protein